MTPGDGDLPSHKDAAPCSRRLPRPPAPRSDPAGSARHRGEAGAGPPLLASLMHITYAYGPAAERAPRPAAAVRLSLPSPGTAEAAARGSRCCRQSRARPTLPQVSCAGARRGVSPPFLPPPPPARPASRENQALFLARALPTVGTPAWQERPDAARQRLVPGPPSPHPARGGDTGDTAPDPRPPPGPGAACPQQPSKQGCPCPGEAPVTPPGLPTGRGAFRPTVAPRAAPRLRGRDPSAEGAGCGGSGRALRPA